MNDTIDLKLIFLAVFSLIGYITITLAGLHQYAGWLLMLFFVFLAFAIRKKKALSGYTYTISILAVVSLAMYYEDLFISIGSFQLSKLIVPLLQIIMFGMGTALSIRDFGQVLKMPKGVLVGLVCQFTIMPFIGWTIAKTFNFVPEIGAGVILIGSCPSGLASNVMAYLARANLALSVTLTAVATLLAPLVTPFYMMLLAGEFIAVNFWTMMWSILQIVIIPVGLGLVFNHFLHGKFKWLDRAMPFVSMIGIALIIGIITAAGRNDLLVIGPLLIFAVFLHNVFGYSLGYWLSRALRMPEADCRTIALEVGLQNGGLATGLAQTMGKLSTVGLAPAVFSSLMNVTGSSLALWWRGRPLPEKGVIEEIEFENAPG